MQGKLSNHKADPILVKGKEGKKKNWTRTVRGL